MSESLLGKKREQSIKKENQNSSDINNENLNKDNEYKDEKPKSLFDNNSKQGLFGDLNKTNETDKCKDTEKAPLFGQLSKNSLFGNNSSSLFNGGSLFSNSSITKGSSLFSNYANQTGNNLLTNNNNNDDEEEDDDVFKKELEEEAKKTTIETNFEVVSDYINLYNKPVENFFSLNKELSKFVSIGKGMVSIEQHKDNLKIIYLIFRNSMGSILLSGLINNILKPAEYITKGYKNLASFAVLEVKQDKKNFKFCKIPMVSKEDVEEFIKVFNDSLDSLKEENSESKDMNSKNIESKDNDAKKDDNNNETNNKEEKVSDNIKENNDK